MDYKKIEIEKNIYQYQFAPDSGSVIGNNVYAVINGKEVCLIDTGYEEHIAKVLLDLDGYDIKKVLLTHFHPDHILGLRRISNAEVFGSVYSLKTLKDFDLLGDLSVYPTIFVEDEMNITFGDFSIKMMLNQGHSYCGMMILVSDLVFVGDDIIRTNYGGEVLPYLSGPNPKKHVQALYKILKNSDKKIILPSHGRLLKNYYAIKESIFVRVKYLNLLDNTHCRQEDAEALFNGQFYKMSWHTNNLKWV